MLVHIIEDDCYLFSQGRQSKRSHAPNAMEPAKPTSSKTCARCGQAFNTRNKLMRHLFPHPPSLPYSGTEPLLS
ncbi:hypothetical protein B0H67DRAFT_594279 [Lasiosphaeris hirsuta]|uniref:C2H2-type domain-containing protein n=1 Tax=Lasiosphaeris hirsuta TaxID=260670 RepID=A0AA40DLD6_9PEZI|nr:hypothetical protein B0H67DRAFT_594279 [Lasiosphaeris hirsuta]